ncbi:idnK [Cyberlindnera jadinii]|uniref:Gluconokinase n=1 Tax=Cyberlindnera jadinii (strain ATCC 18201 / CBS 1600 / BCRC 20928 / JCM 3617 / NBRC 0987 / NRRL Y-1542) TaxID=983966 RepID=A0A0H5C8J5_CYBJN|nr:glucokinase [Cyberlindnera jadinii NRRL Y-1542]ODV72609.1 glucokinase [Cyberlindnera jadinii NRRL Y-1542]CEP24665.1 idnK [Cyberlindnera jadinii]
MTNTVVVVGGTAGTGKTTIGEEIAKSLDCPFVEGDQLHPQSNVEKMSQGIPLTDDDRWGWLEEVAQEGSKRAETSSISVVTCSALKQVYRDLIQKVANNANVIYVFLYASKEELIKRTNARSGHFMKSTMIESQLDTLELPTGNDNALCIDVENKSVEEIKQLGLEFIKTKV